MNRIARRGIALSIEEIDSRVPPATLIVMIRWQRLTVSAGWAETLKGKNCCVSPRVEDAKVRFMRQRVLALPSSISVRECWSWIGKSLGNVDSTSMWWRLPWTIFAA